MPGSISEGSTRYYLGEELALFERAHNWKNYWAEMIRNYVTGDVLEVGAGTGGSIRYLYNGACTRWLCLEPDGYLVRQLRRRIQQEGWHRCSARQAVIGSLEQHESFNAALYIDVLEHIKDDAAEVANVIRHLRPSGYLIVLSPAYPWLFSPFDARIGHHRRYTKRSIQSLIPDSMVTVTLRYIDGCGTAASLANKLLLRQSLPTQKQLQLWDSVLVPLSRVCDQLAHYTVGKSVLGVWRKES